MASLAEQWVEDGFTQGRIEGRNEGRIEGRNEAWVDAVLAVYQERFGAVPRTLKKRLQTASSDDLDSWLRRAATAPSVDEALNGERPGH